MANAKPKDPTAAERSRRYYQRKKAAREREKTTLTLSAAALLAEDEARDVLGDDFERFGAAVRRYVLQVDVAEYARLEWERLKRPMRDTFANGTSGVHPLLKAYEQAEAQSARFAAELGLTPASAKRINPLRRPGRPAGAVSAPDRVGLPPPLLRLAEARGPLMKADVAAVNRARQNAVED